ncbi:hypothetical protein ACIP98_06135 [Streptomyces sp. NPDC088354]|uniref:hypothetical protein n=1 Tax=unclassified Streptomyces TaxID=2593676 RepID=UPI0029B9337A|nr:hypothetical protein [Streptomyces sp. MI02-7b]MDX3073851.1 hypothetical protein [Streptomyces sp. MI02-7b]
MPLTAAQRRALLESDANTGLLGAREATCAALAKQGLAVRYGRTGGHYLTPEGLRVRAELARTEPPAAEPAGPAGVPHGAEADASGFTADDGRGPGPLRQTASGSRAAEVAAAWSGLLEIRRVLQDGDTGRPAPWERDRFVHAVALALEAAGLPPSARDDSGRPARPGYAVAPAAAQDGVAEVSWPSPGDDPAEAALERCRALLEPHGWQCTLHRDRGGRASFLLVSPRRA